MIGTTWFCIGGRKPDQIFEKTEMSGCIFLSYILEYYTGYDLNDYWNAEWRIKGLKSNSNLQHDVTWHFHHQVLSLTSHNTENILACFIALATFCFFNLGLRFFSSNNLWEAKCWSDISVKHCECLPTHLTVSTAVCFLFLLCHAHHVKNPGSKLRSCGSSSFILRLWRSELHPLSYQLRLLDCWVWGPVLTGAAST